MIVREALPAEFDRIAELTVASYRDVHGGEVGGYEAHLRDVATRASASTVLVAVLDGTVVGAAAYVPGPGGPMSDFEDADGCGMRMLAVDPDFQHRGAGRALAEACMSRGRSDGRARMVLFSTGDMRVAHHLYVELGFRREVERDREIETEAGPLLLLAFERSLR